MHIEYFKKPDKTNDKPSHPSVSDDLSAHRRLRYYQRQPALPVKGDHVNSLMEQYGELLQDTQDFRPLLLSLLTDADLTFALPSNMTLGELCREMGETEHGYVKSFSAFKHEWGYKHADPAVTTSLAALQAWYQTLDTDLRAALDALTEDDIATKKVRGGWAGIEKELQLYREALLMFYAKAGVYLRALGKTLPAIWIDWMG
jgi:hypothetical protein